jgi:hypothetical protein
VYHRRIDALEAELLSLADEAPTFSVLCERIGERVGTGRAAPTAFQVLGRWARDELLVDPDPR